jgi:hypothetical protein
MHQQENLQIFFRIKTLEPNGDFGGAKIEIGVRVIVRAPEISFLVYEGERKEERLREATYLPSKLR